MGSTVDVTRRLTATIAACLVLWLLFLTAPGVRALATRCEIFVDDTNVAQAATPGSAIRVEADRALRVSVRANGAIESIDVALLFGPLQVFRWNDPVQPVAEWSDALPVADYARLGAGYYQVAGNLDQCAVSAWVLIESPSPLTTAASLVAFGVLLIGALTAGAGLIAGIRPGRGGSRGRRRSGGLVRAIIGGALVGGSLLVLAQQSGVTPVTTENMVSWTVIPGGLGGATHVLLGAVVVRRPRATGTAEGEGYAYPPDYTPGPTYGQPTPTYGLPPASGAPPSGDPWAYDRQPEGAVGAGAPPSPPVISAPSAPATPPPAPPAAPRPVTRGGHGRATRGATRGATANPPPPTAEEHTSSAPPPDVVDRTAGTPAEDAPPTAGAEPDTAAETTGAFPASVERDPPRESYAHIACPETVVAEEQFELVVGLASKADSEVVGGPLVRPDTSTGPYTMTIQVMADGFRLTRPDESWRVDLRVTGDAPYPTVILHLAAEEQTRLVVARTVRAMYSVDGQAIGLAARPIAVVRDASLLGASDATPAVEAQDIMLPTDDKPPDLTVRIEVSQPAGRLLLQLLAADPLVKLPSNPLVVDIGGEPGLFLRDIIKKMNAVEGQPGMYPALMGIGLTISDQLPTEFWDVVAAVASRVEGRALTILFLSEEPYVPWELAVMEQPLDPSLPPFLSAQASVGRWVLGQRRPKLPPPAQVAVRSMAVVSGVYAQPGWERLVDAEQEADELAGKFGALKVNAASQDVLQLVRGNPPADVLHFAVHGQYDPNGEIDGIVLVDNLTLDPMQIRGSPLGARPFVFLNACQVGSGQAVLGDYAGMAEAFLFAGASGVIAPLWSIDDIMAREIALRFYEKALSGKSPADILREERAAFRDDPATISSTYLAYQFYGHPHMTLDRSAD
ncbi:hypothetical protein BH23CHL6_BH23CHL6_01230 [soil metagenome]